MDTLKIFSEIVNWAVLIFVFTRVIQTDCFNTYDWIITLVAIIFSYFTRYVSNKKEETE